jgi:ubiquitin C-terminal hydrolase
MLEQMRHEMSSRSVSSLTQRQALSINFNYSAFNYFEGFHVSVLESEIVCDNCGNVSRTGGNNERHFPIPIRSRSSRHRASQLSGLIDAYMDEIVDGYRCEKEGCGSVAQKHRVQKIVYAPDILLVQLKRFNWYGSKDCSRIGFSERLNLTRHASHESMGSLDYELVAVVCHQGSVGFGHYICVARTDAKPLSKKWAEYDDQAMCATTVNTAINPTKELGRDWTPYLLFYKRNEETVPTKHFRREECKGILERTGI